MTEKRLWRVSVTEQRSSYVLVLAETPEAAEDDARAFPKDSYDYEVERDFHASPVRDLSKYAPHDVIWTGGEDGEDVFVKNYAASVEQGGTDG